MLLDIAWLESGTPAGEDSCVCRGESMYFEEGEYRASW